MPKKRRRSQLTRDLSLNMPNIKEECIIEDVQIKMEPIDNGYDGGTTDTLSTQIYTADDENWASVEAETGFVSQLDIVKTEVDVDEAAIKDLHEMMKYHSQDDNKIRTQDEAPPKKKRKTDAKKKNNHVNKNKEKKQREEQKKVENGGGTSASNQSNPDQLEPNPLEIIVNGVKMVKCLFCDFQLKRRDRSLVKEHMRIHTGFMPFACIHCPQKFHIRSILLKHIQTDHSSEKIYQCPLCRIYYFTKKDFDAHGFSCVKVRSFQCHLCKFQLNRLFMHKAKDHMRRLHTGERVHQCEHCTKAFVARHQVSSHMQRHHPDVMRYQCSRCRVRFETEEKWKKHEKFCLNQIRYECHLCQYTHPTITLDSMKMHMRKHTGK